MEVEVVTLCTEGVRRYVNQKTSKSKMYILPKSWQLSMGLLPFVEKVDLISQIHVKKTRNQKMRDQKSLGWGRKISHSNKVCKY